MKITFRWYGEGSDKIPLQYIKQIPGCSGIMAAFEQYAAGDAWDADVIRDYVKRVNLAGLELEVIESVNVHEDIKLGLPTRDQYIENYIVTIKNLASNGIKVIVYNFMPVFDWLRTDLTKIIPEDGSTGLFYDEAEMLSMTPQEIVENNAKKSNGFILPGWETERLSELNRVMELYSHFTNEDLRKNLGYFLGRVIPVCEECGVRMAIHPDDPAWPVFGLPRIAHCQEDFDKITALYDSPANSLCLCTGSLGCDPQNDVPSIIRHFGAKGRIACSHVRNLKHHGYRKFQETSHLSTDGSFDMVAIMKAIYETCPDIYIRPDHGRMIWGETGRPGYGLFDRALGIAYLNGIWESLQKAESCNQ